MMQIAIYNQIISMEQQRTNSDKPKNYAKIPLHKRMQLVELVCFKNQTIIRASIKTSIKLSTAKLILKKYKEEGTFFEKREERLARLRAQQQHQQIMQRPQGLQISPINEYYDPCQIQTPFLPYPIVGVNNYIATPSQLTNGSYYMGIGDVASGLLFYGGMGNWGWP